MKADHQKAERSDQQKPLRSTLYDAVLIWLLSETYDERYLDVIFVEFCQKLERQGLPLARAVVNLRVDHPQWLGLRVLWRSGMIEADLRLRETLQPPFMPLRIFVSA